MCVWWLWLWLWLWSVNTNARVDVGGTLAGHWRDTRGTLAGHFRAIVGVCLLVAALVLIFA